MAKDVKSGGQRAESRVPEMATHDCCHRNETTARDSGSQPSSLRSPQIYTCPMHPEVEQDHPGTCPKCGMELEPKFVAADEEEDDSIQ